MNGFLTVYKEFDDGTREYVLNDDKNVITMQSRRDHLRYLWDYANAPRDQISTFKIGIGGAVGDDSQGNNNVKVIPPDATRNELYDSIYIPGNESLVIEPSDSLDNTQVYLKVSFTITQDEANGYRINECGLFKESGDMFNHKTFINVEKTETFALVFEWLIRYI